MTDNSCVWVREIGGDRDILWNTSCGDIFVIMNGTPEENGMQFCCYCGQRIVTVIKEAMEVNYEY